MAPVTRRRGNRFAHLEDVNDREEPVREEPPATYQAHSEAQFASLREQIVTLTKLLSIVGIYPHCTPRRRKMHMWRMKTETLLRSAECIDINPLNKLRPIGGNPISNSIYRNSKVAFNPKSSL
jgi:hypothetical protein